VVEWDRAQLQAVRGDSSNNAVHRLPCQILIDRRYPGGLSPRPDVNISAFVSEFRELFGDVWTLPKVFNAADSIAEDCCLRGALVEACGSVISETKPIQGEPGVLKRTVGLNYGEIQLRTTDVLSPGGGIHGLAIAEAYKVWKKNVPRRRFKQPPTMFGRAESPCRARRKKT
jgi:hypothetical protein